MKLDTIGKEKKLVAATFIFMFMTFAVMGLFMENTVEVNRYGEGVQAFDGDLPIGYYELDSQSSDSKKLKAIVKGSIYEEGSNMTVYGACFDGDSYLLPEANAEFTAWYPNGSIMLGPNATMDKIYDDFAGYSVNGTGRWKIHVTMGDTVGTYLTEMRCTLDGEWAIALGEWQNPEWVVRIGSINNVTNNIQTDLSTFVNDTNTNFQNLLNTISSGDVTASQIRELTEQVTALNANMWTLDETNPFFVLASGTHNFVAVDMLNPNAVGAASADGYFVYWDGETWNEVNTSYEFRGISLLPSNSIYAWVVGTDGANAIYTINGANGTTPTLPSGSPTAFNDVTLFQEPNNPSGDYYVYLLGDEGTVYFSNNAGVNYTDIGSVGAEDKGRFSEIVENYDSFAQADGYMVLAGQGSTLLSHDGTNATTFGVSGTIKDVSLLYYNLGYVVVEDATDTKIYKWNGTGLNLEYTIEDPSIVPTGVEILTQNDVWVTTTDPSTFYHFDGRRWVYSTVGYSEAVSVVISFNGGGNTTTQGVQDVVLTDSRHGYAVGQDGIILVFEAELKSQLDVILAAIGNANVNLTPILDEIAAANATVHLKLDALNNSLQIELTNIDNTLYSMNQTIELNFVEVDQALAGLNTSVFNLNVSLYDFQQIVEGNFSALFIEIANLNNGIASNFSAVNNVLQEIQLNQTQTQNLINLLNTTITNNQADLLVQFGNLNLTLNEFYTAAQGNWSVINTKLDNLDSLTNNIVELLGSNVLAYDGAEEGTFTDNWQHTATDGVTNYSNGASAYVDVWSLFGVVEPAEIWQGMEGAYVIKFDNANIVPRNLYYFNNPDYLALTDEEKWDDVTYQINYYDTGIVYPGGSYNYYLGMNFALDDTDMWWFGVETQFAEYDVIIPSTASTWGSVGKRREGWHTMQAYFSNYNGTNVDVQLLYDGRVVAEEKQAPTTDLNGFSISARQAGPDDMGYVDGVVIYEGAPRDAGLISRVRDVQRSVDNVELLVNSMNATMVTRFDDLDVFLGAMNASLDLKLDNILANTTYTNLYLETTLFPLINGTYANTVQILVDLGIIKTQLNQTLAIVNNTNQIVNETATDVDELVNRSRRIRAWVTQ